MQYDDSWDCPHEASDDRFWQESDAYWAYDDKAGVGIYQRIGRHQNMGTGQVQVFAFKTGGQRFRLSDLEESNGFELLERGHKVGSSVAESLGDKCMNFRWEEKDCAADLEFYQSFYEPRHWDLATSDSNLDLEFNNEGHLEVSGRLRGKVRIGEETYNVDALAHRDRSWGKRDTSRVAQHRQMSGTIGPELSWNVVLIQLKGGQTMTVGFVVRDGKHEQVTKVQTFTTVDYDSMSLLDSRFVFTTEAGEEIPLAGECQQGFLNEILGSRNLSDAIMRTDSGGLYYYTAALNAFRGDYAPSQEDAAHICVSNGLSNSVEPAR